MTNSQSTLPTGKIDNCKLKICHWLLAGLWLLMSALSLCAQSTNKTFMIGTNNALRPSDSNFFVVNSNLLNQAIAPNGGGSGSPQTPWAQNINGAGYTLSNANTVSITNLIANSNAYVALTNSSGYVVVTNTIAIGADDMLADNAGNLSGWDPTSGIFTWGFERGGQDGYIETGWVVASNYFTPLAGTALAPNMQLRRATNYEGANFAFTAPANVNMSFFSHTEILITNTSGSPINASCPANWWTNGIPWSVTNLGLFIIEVDPGWATNMIYRPIEPSTGPIGGGGGGSVTSVTFTGDGTVLSSTPSGAVTTTGTLTATLANASPNTVLAGPSSGGAAAPTYQSAPTISGANLVSLPSGASMTNLFWQEGVTNTNAFPYVAGMSPYLCVSGDSLSAGNGTGYGYLNVSNYSMFLSNYYGFKFAVWSNTAAAGQTAATMAATPQSFIPWKLGAGTNGLFSDWCGINDIGLSGAKAETVFSNLNVIWTAAHQSNLLVVAFTVNPVLTNTDAQMSEIHRLNSMIRNSPTNWDYLVDVAAFLPTPNNSNQWYIYGDSFAPDVVHLTNYGQWFVGYNWAQVVSRGPHWQGTKYEPTYWGPSSSTLITPAGLLAATNAVQAELNAQFFATTNQSFLQTVSAAGQGVSFMNQNTDTANTGSYSQIGTENSDANEYGKIIQVGTDWSASSYYKKNSAQIQVGSDDTVGLDFQLLGGGHYNFYHSGPLGSLSLSLTSTGVSTPLTVFATNGFASYNTNVLTSAAATSWSGQISTINNGFTNTYGTNCTININGSTGYFVFWHSGGAVASTVAANPQFTNALSTNGWSRSLPINCGVQVFPLTGQANVTVDFGQ